MKAEILFHENCLYEPPVAYVQQNVGTPSSVTWSSCPRRLLVSVKPTHGLTASFLCLVYIVICLERKHVIVVCEFEDWNVRRRERRFFKLVFSGECRKYILASVEKEQADLFILLSPFSSLCRTDLYRL